MSIISRRVILWGITVAASAGALLNGFDAVAQVGQQELNRKIIDFDRDIIQTDLAFDKLWDEIYLDVAATTELGGSASTMAGTTDTVDGRAEDAATTPYFEMGARTWVSFGQTEWNHDASGAVPTLGNPTSVLEYQDADALILEVNGKVGIFDGLFIRANYGQDAVDIGEGTLVNSDFAVIDGGAPSLRSRNDIEGLEVWYVTVDVGWEFYRSPEGFFGVFVGYQHWKEEYRTRGLTNLICTGAFGGCLPLGVDLLPGVDVIGNKVEWDSIRVGVSGSAQITDRLSVSGEAVGIPYTDMYNEDSHHLRTDLSPVPNIIMDGSGYGFQGEINLDYEILTNSSLVASLGFRYWTLMSDGSLTFKVADGSTATFPLNGLDTERYGATVALTYRF